MSVLGRKQPVASHPVLCWLDSFRQLQVQVTSEGSQMQRRPQEDFLYCSLPPGHSKTAFNIGGISWETKAMMLYIYNYMYLYFIYHEDV